MKTRAVILTPPSTRWQCPNCDMRSVSRESRPHSQMHTCPGLGGILAPMIHEGMSAKVEAIEREDAVNGEQGLRYDDRGRPIMAVRTTRSDGYDTVVFPASATLTREEVEDSGLAKLIRERMRQIREAANNGAKHGR